MPFPLKPSKTWRKTRKEPGAGYILSRLEPGQSCLFPGRNSAWASAAMANVRKSHPHLTGHGYWSRMSPEGVVIARRDQPAAAEPNEDSDRKLRNDGMAAHRAGKPFDRSASRPWRIGWRIADAENEPHGAEPDIFG